ncbi:MAG: response regulator [Rhizobacter sp.]|nr:response regulator [Ferruginibacter sp.]
MNKNSVFFIADDDPDDQEIFVKALREIDEFCMCIIASDGREAVEKLLSLQPPLPDFIFLDLNMPRMDGRQTLREIKKHTHLQPIPVIIYSTSADKKEMQETMEMGAALFLQKPNRFDDLCKFLEQIIKQQKD